MTKQEILAKIEAGEKKSLYALKMAQTKQADAVCYSPMVGKANTVKAEGGGDLRLKVVINTTNLMDSHDDVHIPGLWNKSITDRGQFLFLKEHKMSFDDILDYKAKGETQKMDWSELGASYPGQTEALIFNPTITQEAGKMYELYTKGLVTNHSVGMQYVKLFLAINEDSKYTKEEFENWEKFYPMIANKEAADESGVFWAVTEAKIIEGSAVPMGSNWITPTLEAVADTSDKSEPSLDTQAIVNFLSNRKFTI